MHYIVRSLQTGTIGITIAVPHFDGLRELRISLRCVRAIPITLLEFQISFVAENGAQLHTLNSWCRVITSMDVANNA